MEDIAISFGYRERERQMILTSLIEVWSYRKQQGGFGHHVYCFLFSSLPRIQFPRLDINQIFLRSNTKVMFPKKTSLIYLTALCWLLYFTSCPTLSSNPAFLPLSCPTSVLYTAAWGPFFFFSFELSVLK